VRPLHRLHVDLGDLPHGGYLSKVINEGIRFSVVAILQRKSKAEVAVCNAIAWFECQTDLRVPREVIEAGSIWETTYCAFMKRRGSRGSKGRGTALW
jgi:hypothetical protein